MKVNKITIYITKTNRENMKSKKFVQLVIYVLKLYVIMMAVIDNRLIYPDLST